MFLGYNGRSAPGEHTAYDLEQGVSHPRSAQTKDESVVILI